MLTAAAGNLFTQQEGPIYLRALQRRTQRTPCLGSGPPSLL
jgi:hypothetical protein